MAKMKTTYKNNSGWCQIRKVNKRNLLGQQSEQLLPLSLAQHQRQSSNRRWYRFRSNWEVSEGTNSFCVQKGQFHKWYPFVLRHTLCNNTFPRPALKFAPSNCYFFRLCCTELHCRHTYICMCICIRQRNKRTMFFSTIFVMHNVLWAECEPSAYIHYVHRHSLICRRRIFMVILFLL